MTEPVYLRDYAPYGFLVEDVALRFDLHPTATRVTSTIRFAPNPKATNRDFVLDGEELTLISAKIDGTEITPTLTDKGLTCPVPNGPFTWEAVVEINPKANTALEGLYLSGGMYCTQCEAQGFRKITYYPDRPDVMARFRVRIQGDAPVLLSNGNPTAQGEGWAEWDDPWPKPAYLFALVAGDLVAHSDRFQTRTGQDVALNIWVRPDDINKCAFAMQALKSSMAWDEQVYGRVYDLDVFNIVAVDDFNMGAMENKGLNIFNSAAVLASAETATDANFERIEAIIAHEYFHNWTGNRITCRDWFQLCLKEGLTVFRDAEFTSDMRSAPVKRISDVMVLRAHQFPEDQGPLAHPVRPESYQEINNFYTATVYEKGAELIRMLKILVGDAAYSKALDLYFERHDGEACTIEDWLRVFEDSTGRDLTQFKRWYTQAGTPELTVHEAWSNGTYTLTFRQETKPSTPSPDPQPQLLPIAVGLLGRDGREIRPTTVLEMTQTTQSFRFTDLPERPIPSILRGFSAPVVLKTDPDPERLAFLLAHDTDPFNRWDAARSLAQMTLIAMITQGAAPQKRYLDGLAKLVEDDRIDPATRALMLALPEQSALARSLHDLGTTPDPDTIWTASQDLKQALAERLQDLLEPLYTQMQVTTPYRPNAAQAGQRALGNALLSLLSLLDGAAAAARQFQTADNMTQSLGALVNLVRLGKGAEAVAAFYTRWQHDRLVMDKWFALQIQNAPPQAAPEITKTLTQHADFAWTNPNRFRATLGALAGHHAGFHRADGAGYTLLADWLIKLDQINPQTTARMCGAFQTWRRYDPARQALIKAQLERIAAQPNLSRDVNEMVSRILAA